MTRMSRSRCAFLAVAAGLRSASCSISPDPTVAGHRAASAGDARSLGERCGAELTRGTYLFECAGSARNGTENPPISMVGSVKGDGQGELVGRTTVSLGGAIFQKAIDGFAKIEPDCRGAITFSVMVLNAAGWVAPPPPEGEIHLEFVVLADGDRLEGKVVDAGSAVRCELRRQHALEGQRTTTAWAAKPGGD